ncbi:hypothetical protein QF042_005161 [Pedobacter sp. W3I1]|nr:hypothetical protein [Pedobacter sp. W3I1]
MLYQASTFVGAFFITKFLILKETPIFNDGQLKLVGNFLMINKLKNGVRKP